MGNIKVATMPFIALCHSLRKHIVCCSSLLLLLFSSLRCYGDYPSLLSELDQNQRVANCGVWVTSFILKLNSIPFDISKVASSLGTNTSWDQPVDMAHMRDVLESSGLHTQSFKNAAIDEVIQELGKSSNSVAVLHLQNDFNRVGHYIILMAADASGALFIDMGDGRDMTKLTPKQVAERIKNDFSGFCMFVNSDPRSATAVLDGADFKVNGGDIASGPGVLQVRAKVTNPQKEPVALLNTKGSCSCFKSAFVEGGDGKTIPAQGSATIVFEFDRSRIGAGAVERDVLLGFSGIKGKDWIRATIAVNITIDKPRVQLTWFPETINIGQQGNRTVGAQEFTIFVPAGDILGDPQVSSGLLNVLPIKNVEGKDNEVDEAGRIVRRFRLDLSKLPPGAVREKVTLSTSDKYTPFIVVNIVGEIINK